MGKQVTYGLADLVFRAVYQQAGLVLVGSCPGGTISNVVSHVAKADVPLSVVLTSISTLCAIFMTPWLTWLLCGAVIEVDPVALMFSVRYICWPRKYRFYVLKHFYSLMDCT